MKRRLDLYQNHSIFQYIAMVSIDRFNGLVDCVDNLSRWADKNVTDLSVRIRGLEIEIEKLKNGCQQDFNERDSKKAKGKSSISPNELVDDPASVAPTINYAFQLEGKRLWL